MTPPLLAEYPLEELVALYAAGALTPAEEAAFENRRAAGWPEAEALMAAFSRTVTDLVADAPEVVPPPAVRAAVMAALDPPPGYTVLAADDTQFRPTDHLGVSMRLLHVDRRRGHFSCLLRFAPGARLPAHPHAQPEECVVLEGSVLIGGVRMRAGDYQRVEAGVDHVDQWSDTGGLAFVTAPLDLLSHD
jgi:hypothetical protein